MPASILLLTGVPSPAAIRTSLTTLLGCCLFAPSARAEPPPNAPTLIIVVGAPGSEDYRKQFSDWADRWAAAAARGDARVVRIGDDPAAETTAANEPADVKAATDSRDPQPAGRRADRDRLRDELVAAAGEPAAPLWLVLIGHGTFDGREAKFNLHGPDVSLAELAAWIAPLRRALAVVDCSAASGPFLTGLSAPGRVVITATRSGGEHSFARFGDALSSAIGDAAADLDKDGQTSLLEAFLLAARRTEEFYAHAGRLATEHALLDDNGDGHGTPASWFDGTRVTRRAKGDAAPDGALASGWRLAPGEAERRLLPAALARRAELEQSLAQLRGTRSSRPADEYYAELEKLLVEMARLYESEAGEPGK